ncbi:unnamed protein product [Peronospora belbahrii]|uniref:Uncharacterized protein n=1 Tax=Peronospora belbahrii TaxID=622444 RepID=A0AAU9KQ40_9STRA|nr:unnamed protein product [Peronospora belbahrii]CAH0514744.1 unnamed protein product [Peronospora belbahrii]
MKSLNCFSGRANVEMESELEAASKLVERAFIRIQKSERKAKHVQQAIKDTRKDKIEEMVTHLQWLLEHKKQLEQDLDVLDKKLKEKRMRIKERTG